MVAEGYYCARGERYREDGCGDMPETEDLLGTDTFSREQAQVEARNVVENFRRDRPRSAGQMRHFVGQVTICEEASRRNWGAVPELR